MSEQSGTAYSTEVIESQQSFLTVREPMNLPSQDAVPVGSRLLVTWTEAQGRIHLPVILAARGEDETWVLDVTAEPWREQRRRYDRTAVDLIETVQLRPAAPGSDEDAATGQLVDLSEVGLRCAVKDPPEYLNVAGTPVEVQLVLSGAAMNIPGKVMQTRAGRPEEPREVVILFDRPVVQAEQIRDYVSRSALGS
jgi:hypothetical protein